MLQKDGRRLQIGQGEVYADVRRNDGDAVTGDVMRRPKILANGLVIKNARVAIRHNTNPAVFFPGHDPQRTFNNPNRQQLVETEEIIEAVVPSDVQFVQVKRGSAEDIYADFGLISDDDDDVIESDASDSSDAEELVPSEVNKPNFADPEDVFEMLATKDIRTFGITKEDFAALKLTKGQTRKLYESVTGKSSNKLEGQTMRKEIRKIASQSLTNYKRVLGEIKLIRSPE